jgi:hypothetical protein
MASDAFRTSSERFMHVPPKGCGDECVDFAPGRERLSTGASGKAKAGRGTAPEGWCAPPAPRAGFYGTVMVVPSPVAVMENVPAVLEVYA